MQSTKVWVFCAHREFVILTCKLVNPLHFILTLKPSLGFDLTDCTCQLLCSLPFITVQREHVKDLLMVSRPSDTYVMHEES